MHNLRIFNEVFVLVLIMLVLLLGACSKNDVNFENAEVDVKFNFKTDNNSSKHSGSELPPCSDSQSAYAEIVINGPENIGTITNPFRVNIASGTNRTESLRIPEGTYSLIYFAVFDEADNMVWFAPTENENSSFVINPLPITFNIVPYETETVSVDVLCLEDRNLNGIPLTGFNMRWRDTPDLSERLYRYVDSLKPDLLRYPGGTLAHKWNWKTGLPEPSNSSDFIHLIEDVRLLSDNANSDIIFVLDVVNSSIENQIEMLKAANVPIRYIELGNELYADDYNAKFPSGATYAELVNEWVPQLEIDFPDAKFGAVMLGREAGSDRKNNWNSMVNLNITVDIDAYIYHIYSNETETIANRISRFEDAFINDTGKELWITEYGARSGLIEDTNELADYIESIADIALNHVLISKSGNFTKLTEDINYTDEGLLFLSRNNPNID